MGFLKKSAFFQDIDTISDFLGEKKYLMGEEVRDKNEKHWHSMKCLFQRIDLASESHLLIGIEAFIEMRESKFESCWAKKTSSPSLLPFKDFIPVMKDYFCFCLTSVIRTHHFVAVTWVIQTLIWPHTIQLLDAASYVS